MKILGRGRRAPSLERRTSKSAGPSVAAVSVRGVSKRFGEIVAVEKATLDVAPGEILALLGPSGCGKTTFLRLIAGFERPDEGTISLAGREVAGGGNFVQPEKRRVGLVFQDYALFPHLCVGDNVAFGISGPDCDGRVREVLHLVGLSGQSDRFPNELSGGQQQRVALARALAPRPDIILLDEPFSNLDASLRHRVRTEVREILRHANATAIFVTHDQEEALSLADRVAIMAEGRVRQVATPHEIYTNPGDLFVAGFVGGANIVGGTSDGRDVRCPLGTIQPIGDPPPGPVMLVVRPESLLLRLDPDGDALVQGSTFYGHDQTVKVRLRDGEVVDVRTGTGRFYEPGARVSVSVVPGEVLAFPASALP